MPDPAESSTRRSSPCSSREVRPPAKQNKVHLVKRMIDGEIFRDYHSARQNKTDSELIIADTSDEKIDGVSGKGGINRAGHSL